MKVAANAADTPPAAAAGARAPGAGRAAPAAPRPGRRRDPLSCPRAQLHSTFFTSQKPGRSWLTAAALSGLVTATTRAASPRTASSTSANSLRGHEG
jgi:hypothetical protein